MVINAFLSERAAKPSPWNSFFTRLDENPKMSDAEAMKLFSETLSKAGSDWKDANGNTVLMLIAGRGRTNIAKRLIKEFYVSARTANKDGWTALHMAARAGDKAMCELLINEGHADVSARTNDNKDTPANCAEGNGHKELSDFLRRQETKTNLFRLLSGNYR